MKNENKVTPLSVFLEIKHRVIIDEKSPFKTMLNKAQDIDIDYFEKIERSIGVNRLSEQLNLGVKDQVVDAFGKMADEYYVNGDLLEQLKTLALQEVEKVEDKKEFLRTLAELLELCADSGIPSAGWSRYSNEDLQELYKNAKKITLMEFIRRNNMKDILEFYSALMDNTWWTCRELIVDRTKTFLRNLSREIGKAADNMA